MATVTVKGIADLRALLKTFESETAYVASVALNNTAFSCRDYLTGTMDQYLDRPNPFTKQALVVDKATKANLRSAVRVQPTQASYLVWQIAGGIETPKNRALVVPWNLKRDRYGNMPGGAVKKLLGTKGVFSGTVRGIPGIWQRWTETFNVGGTVNIGGSHLQLIVAYEPKANYVPRWPMLTKGVEWGLLRWNIEAEAALKRILK